jgi:hypothetical protein
MIGPHGDAGSRTQPIVESGRPAPPLDPLMDAVRFGVPRDYRLVPMVTPATVECARGCGWSLAVSTLSAMPTEIREQLRGDNYICRIGDD